MRILDLFKKIIETLKNFFYKFIHTPLLLAWVIIGTIFSWVTGGFRGFLQTIINLIIVVIFAVIIKLMTSNDEKPIKLYRPKTELFVGIIFYIFQILLFSSLWHLANIPLLNNLQINLLKTAQYIFKQPIPSWLIPYLQTAFINTIILSIPIIFISILFKYNLKEMGFNFKNIKLIITLITITLITGAISKILIANNINLSYFSKTALIYPVTQIIPIYFVHIFINGLPEELFFRGFLLPRFENILGNSINALVIVSLLFNITHIPSHIALGISLPKSLLFNLSISYPSGLIWGYLYIKTRSIVPGLFWHTSLTTIGVYLISISKL